MSHTQDINNKVQNIKNAAMRVYGSQGLEATHGSLNPTTTCSNTWRPPTSTNRSSATWRCVCAPAATSPVASSSR